MIITCIAENHFGLMVGQSITNNFLLRQIIENIEENKGIYIVFMDLQKAYDRVLRE